jgi:hypothetical protein
VQRKQKGVIQARARQIPAIVTHGARTPGMQQTTEAHRIYRSVSHRLTNLPIRNHQSTLRLLHALSHE